ncbi:MAG: hypothetical protein WCS54_05870, partial [Fibrobacteraceae bacterium]
QLVSGANQFIRLIEKTNGNFAHSSYPGSLKSFWSSRLLPLFPELVACELKEYEAQHYMLAFGRFDASAQFIGGFPKRGFYGFLRSGFLDSHCFIQ